ncbi:MAG TPA: type II toxin-antitoxin system HipA family toxin [Candidatus Limnocylindria bacterium]|jgi:serine/threonine-protein kinase HipA|nr:type II toxin-antitoxin system HipA family toxin [Candidatus Limnocylindria bacterium]
MIVEVHIDWRGQTDLVGRLYTADHGPSVSFEYDPAWLKRENAFAIDPASLPLQRNGHHGGTLFGAIQDCGPDRWGRILIERAFRKKILPKKPFQDGDYVLALDDSSRLGALRFRTTPDGPFLAASTGKLPPLVRLNSLLAATEAIHNETETAQDLRFLLGAGSPLGGARPKAAVALPDGRLAIAKFPKPDDTRDIEAGEILALTLAQQAGIQVADHQLVPLGGKSVAVVTRFDRDSNGRIPFLSAASLLALPQGNDGTYTMIADAIREYGSQVENDLRELWRRMVFSLLASNYDDHLRNHGFLMRQPGRWSLSPAYDLNPVPEIDRSHTSKTSIDEEAGEPAISHALGAAERFGMAPKVAMQVLREVYAAVSAWRKVARQYNLKASTLDAYASAFDHRLMEEARQLV